MQPQSNQSRSASPRLQRLLCLALLGAFALTGLAHAQQDKGPLPRTWVDKDTGHRITRLTDEPGSSAFYFNVNAYTPDGKLMVYTAPDGIHVLEMDTHKTRLVVPNPPHVAGEDRGAYRALHTVVVGHKTNSVFYTQIDETGRNSTVFKADLYTGKVTKLTELPRNSGIATVNADETLAAGTYIVGDQNAARDYNRQRAANTTPATGNAPQSGNLVQPLNKGEMMEQRLAAHLPLVLFTVRLEPGAKGEKPGTITKLLDSTDWVNHLLFSPTDPELLMYCHEGPWQKVDRIWMIHTDGTHNMLIHKRTMTMEIAGHEFWGLDGETIWYDWQYPKGEDFFVAGYEIKTGRRIAYHLQRNEWSIHFNLTPGQTLFTGDGGDKGQVAKAPDGRWIELFHPQMLRTDGINEPSFWQPGVFHSEHLVNMLKHNYRLEPNVRFSPDTKMVLFTSNMFGPSYVFGVEVAKAVDPPAADVKSTPELGTRYAPQPPAGSPPPM
jgi:oligogalacturonide lyase